MGMAGAVLVLVAERAAEGLHWLAGRWMDGSVGWVAIAGKQKVRESRGQSDLRANGRLAGGPARETGSRKRASSGVDRRRRGRATSGPEGTEGERRVDGRGRCGRRRGRSRSVEQRETRRLVRASIGIDRVPRVAGLGWTTRGSREDSDASEGGSILNQSLSHKNHKPPRRNPRHLLRVCSHQPPPPPSPSDPSPPPPEEPSAPAPPRPSRFARRAR